MKILNKTLIVVVLLFTYFIYSPMQISAHNSESLDQTGFWFRDDDGGESCSGGTPSCSGGGATGWGASDTAEDTNITNVSNADIFRLRFEIDDTTSASTNNQAYEVEFSSDATSCSDDSGNETWNVLTSTSSEWQIVSSTNFTDQATTTNIIGSGIGSFVAGSIQDSTTTTVPISFGNGSDDFTEVEWSIGANTPSPNTTYRFRIVRSNGTTIQAYSTCPQLTTAQEVAISLNTDGSVAFGILGFDDTRDTTPSGINDVETISVDTGPVDLVTSSTDFSRGAPGANTWNLSTTNGSEQVVFEFSNDGSSWTTFAIANTYYTLENNVSQGSTSNIYLRLNTPTTSGEGREHSATVTVTATAP